MLLAEGVISFHSELICLRFVEISLPNLDIMVVMVLNLN